jgi:uncharacterized CHY-type Zn-finger protein
LKTIGVRQENEAGVKALVYLEMGLCKMSNTVHGLEVGACGGCAHYRSPLDSVAIEFRCCKRFFACHLCHDALADHSPQLHDDPDTRAILCCRCGAQLTIASYLAGPSECPSCQAPFNPGCKKHAHLYFKLHDK